MQQLFMSTEAKLIDEAGVKPFQRVFQKSK